MDDRKKTAAAVVILVGFFVVLVFVLLLVFKGKKVVSPVPDDNVIKIIFVTPVPNENIIVASPSAAPLVTPKDTPEKR